MAAFDAIMDDAKAMAENAKYWQAAVERMFAQARRARAKGREFTPPDWFIWLDRYDLSIAPSRVKSLMAALSVKGRVAVMGLVLSVASQIDVEIDSLDRFLFHTDLRSPRIHPYAGCTDPAKKNGFGDPPIKSADDEKKLLHPLIPAKAGVNLSTYGIASMFGNWIPHHVRDERRKRLTQNLSPFICETIAQVTILTCLIGDLVIV